MNTNDKPLDILIWLKEQVQSISKSIVDLEKNQNYGKATLCEGMREAYIKCIERLQAAA